MFKIFVKERCIQNLLTQNQLGKYILQETKTLSIIIFLFLVILTLKD